MLQNDALREASQPIGREAFCITTPQPLSVADEYVGERIGATEKMDFPLFFFVANMLSLQSL